MADRVPTLRKMLQSLLCAWMAVALTSTSIEHAHAGGSKAHSHNIGWLNLSVDSTLKTERHRHRLFAGVEMPAEPCENSSQDTVLTSGSGSPATLDVQIEAEHPVAVAVFVESSARQYVSTTLFVVTASPSHFALRAVSGVRLI